MPRPSEDKALSPLVEGLRAFLCAQGDADALDEVAQETFLRSLRAKNAPRIEVERVPLPSAALPREPRAGEAGRMLELLDAAMDRLPASYRRPLELRMAGGTIAQIAHATGQGVTETRATLWRARQALLGLLEASVARRARPAEPGSERRERPPGLGPLSERGLRE